MAIKNLGNAIKEINPNAEFICDEDNLDNIQWINGTTAIAKADIEARLTEAETALANEEQARIDAETQKATDKANGNQKLLDLGLTQAEATALTGYKPEE